MSTPSQHESLTISIIPKNGGDITIITCTQAEYEELKNNSGQMPTHFRIEGGSPREAAEAIKAWQLLNLDD